MTSSLRSSCWTSIIRKQVLLLTSLQVCALSPINCVLKLTMLAHPLLLKELSDKQPSWKSSFKLTVEGNWCSAVQLYLFVCLFVYYLTPPVSERNILKMSHKNSVTCKYLCRCSAAAERANPDTVQRSLHHCETLQSRPSAQVCRRLSRMSRLCSRGGPVSEQRLGWRGCTGKVWLCHAGGLFQRHWDVLFLSKEINAWIK